MQRLKRGLYWAGLLLGGGLFLYQLWVGLKGLQGISFGWKSVLQLAAATALMLMVVGLQMLNWRFILVAFGFKIRLGQIFEGYVLSFLPRYIPGSVWGYLSRSEWLHQQHQVPYLVSNVSSLIEVGASFLTCVMVTGLITGPRFPVAVLGVLGLSVASWLVVRRAARLFLLRNPKWQRIGASLLGLSWGAWVGWLLNCLVQWFLLGWVTLLCVAAVGGSFSTQWALAASVFGLAWFIGLVILFVPAGLGVREFAFKNFLQLFLVVPNPIAALAVVLIRLLYSFAELTWLLGALLVKRLIRAR
ncbi:MAG: hypothetical protein LDL12_04365 [Anaerolinea sp.]|nr:hypothetical protein [Anaerolinea sp.]